MEVTIADKINYWKKKLKVGSEWLTVEFEPQTIKIVDVAYLHNINSVIVEFTSEEFPHLIEFLPVDQFVDGRFIRNN